MNRKDAKDAKEGEARANHRSHEIIGAAIEVHQALGPGLLESVYESAMAVELSLREIPFRRQVRVPLRYKGTVLSSDLKVDMIVDELVVVELKSVNAVLPIHDAQVLTYLRLTGAWVGLMLNFNSVSMREGIRRFVITR